MPLIYQDLILRHHLRANPTHYFVFGDNFIHAGFGGQAKEMRGEPNAIGIPTKHSPSRDPAAYFSDAQYSQIIPKLTPIFTQIEHLLITGKFVIFPSSGIGTGLAKLETCAPRINEFIKERIKQLEAI